MSKNTLPETMPQSVAEAFRLDRHLAEARGTNWQWDATRHIAIEEQLLLHP
jgi:hypothetical protein